MSKAAKSDGRPTYAEIDPKLKNQTFVARLEQPALWGFCYLKMRDFWKANGRPNRTPPLNWLDPDNGKVGWFFPQKWVSEFKGGPFEEAVVIWKVPKPSQAHKPEPPTDPVEEQRRTTKVETAKANLELPAAQPHEPKWYDKPMVVAEAAEISPELKRVMARKWHISGGPVPEARDDEAAE